MLKFLVLHNGQPAPEWPVRNAYLLGSDGSAMRGTITYEDQVLVCHKREMGTCALALQVPVGDCGDLTLQTCLLPERDQPYLLSLELARHRLMLLYNKSEDWGMFDIRTSHPVGKRIEKARELFVEALCHQGDNIAKCDELAKQCLGIAVDCSEELAMAHADLLLGRRRAANALPRRMFGAGVNLSVRDEALRDGILSNFDFVYIPTPWKSLAPEEGDYNWAPLSDWIRWSVTNRLPIIAGPIVSFETGNLPDWFFIWEHDYDTARDLLYEHVERLVTQYKDYVSIWNVVSGLHINSHFTVTFDQLMDLSRMTSMLVKKTQPQAKVMVEIQQPFGEYYGSNQRSIPPMMYVDLLAQGAIHFDALSIRVLMGQPIDGQFTRDIMQLSNLLDQFAAFGKPLNVVVAVPSNVVTREMVATPDPNAEIDMNCGRWRKPWSPDVQAKWFDAVLHVAMSKPFVESVIWQDVVDHPQIELPMGGIINENLTPKPALQRLTKFREMLVKPPTA